MTAPESNPYSNLDKNPPAAPRFLLVGPYAPRKCGIATHVMQLEQALHGARQQVDVLSPPDCAGTLRADLKGGLKILRLLKYAEKYDRINIHFESDQFFLLGRTPLRVLNFFSLLALWVVFRRLPNLNVVMHEPPPSRWFFQRTALHRWVWSAVPKITFFTQRELRRFEGTYRMAFAERQRAIEDVTGSYQKYCSLSKAQVRSKWGIDQTKLVFLCVGFIHRNKGFDRVVDIFRSERLSNSQLYVVGSVRLEEDRDSHTYLAGLVDAARDCRDIHFRNRYLTDEELDEWIVAADYVVVPYRFISNSGIVGRAKIYGRKKIVADVGGLAEQVDAQDFIFSGDDELKALLKAIDVQFAAQPQVSRAP